MGLLFALFQEEVIEVVSLADLKGAENGLRTPGCSKGSPKTSRNQKHKSDTKRIRVIYMLEEFLFS